MSKFGKPAAIWIALVAVAVCGRWLQPAYGVSPLTGVAIVAGTVFTNPLVAATVPLAGLGISNLDLPGYGSSFSGWALATVVAVAFAWQVVLGRLARGRRGGAVLTRRSWCIARRAAPRHTSITPIACPIPGAH